MVLIPRYGKWFLSGRDDGAGKIDIGIYYAVRSIRMAKNAFRVEKCSLDLPTVDCYGFLKIKTGSDENTTNSGGINNKSPRLQDVFTEVEPYGDSRPSVLGRRSYIDDIVITARLWSSLYEK